MSIQELATNLKEQNKAARRIRKQMADEANALAMSNNLALEDYVYQWIGEDYDTAFVHISDFGTITIYENRAAETGMVLDDAALIRFYKWVSDNKAA